MANVKPTYMNNGGLPQPVNTATDSVAANAVYVQNSTTPDTNVGISRDVGNNLVLTDSVSGSYTLATLAAGGGGLTNWTEAVSTAAPNATVPVDSFTATNAATDVDAALVAKNAGATLAQVPDSAATGGDKRGTYATDWQKARTVAARVAAGNYSTVAGGYDNRAGSTYSAVLGGESNLASGASASIAGGRLNTASGQYAFIGAGATNTAAAQYGTVAGGQSNNAYGFHCVVAGGQTNVAGVNLVPGVSHVTVGGGQGNNATGQYSAVVGGVGNTAGGGARAFVGGGSSNTASSTTSTVAGGGNNSASAIGAAVLGGQSNAATGQYAAVGGGSSNSAGGDYAFIGSGQTNVTTNAYATIGGGNTNNVSGQYGTVGGGQANNVSGQYGVVAGGTNNIANAASATVAGGSNNTAGSAAFVGGGQGNSAVSQAAVAGGQQNAASGQYAFIGSGANLAAGGTASGIISGINITTRGIRGRYSYGTGSFAAAVGKTQAGKHVTHGQTTTNTPLTLTADAGAVNSSNVNVLPDTSAYAIRCTVVARDNAGTTAAWEIGGLVKRDAGAATTAVVGVPLVTSLGADAGAAAWTVALIADTTQGAAVVQVTDGTGTPTIVEWVATMFTTEIDY